MITTKQSNSDSTHDRELSNRKPARPPDWLDRDAFRRAMTNKVNQLSRGRWGAVSMRNGIIWFRYQAILEVLKEASGRHPGVLALAVDKNAMNDLVYAVLTALGDHCVIWGMLGQGYTACKCNVIGKNGEIIETVFLTPVRASWLFYLSSWFERSKPHTLRQKVRKIVPTCRVKNEK